MDRIKQYRQFIYNMTKNWQMAAHLKDEDVIAWMEENYPDYLTEFKWKD